MYRCVNWRGVGRGMGCGMGCGMRCAVRCRIVRVVHGRGITHQVRTLTTARRLTVGVAVIVREKVWRGRIDGRVGGTQTQHPPGLSGVV